MFFFSTDHSKHTLSHRRTQGVCRKCKSTHSLVLSPSLVYVLRKSITLDFIYLYYLINNIFWVY